MIAFVAGLRVAMEAFLLYRIYLGDRWALVLVLTFMTLQAEIVGVLLRRMREGRDGFIGKMR